MKIENEVTGEIDEVIESYVGIRLHICSFEGITDFFSVDTEEKEILIKLNETTKILLKMEHTFEDYMQLIKDLGLEIRYKTHWKPSENETFYFVTQYSSVNMSFDDEELHKKAMLIKNYNVFPTRELAERAINLSKLDRLILLWQYKNNCLFTPDWKNINQPKHSVIYVEMYKELRADTSYTVRNNKTYFETAEQVKTFIKVYDKEIKKIMGVII